MKKIDVLGIGLCALDFLAIVPKKFKTDTRIKVEELVMQGGGPIGTALVALARLGANAAYMGSFADDQPGHLLREDFKKEGVDTAYSVFLKGTVTPMASILVHSKTGKRTIFYPSFRNTARIRNKSGLNKEAIKKCKILHIDQFQPEVSIEAAKTAGKSGVRVVLDIEGMTRETPELIEVSDVFISDEMFLSEFTRRRDYLDGISQLQKKYKEKMIVVTVGSGGSYVAWGGRILHVPAFRVKVKDTTGAGDVYHGAFIYGLLKKWDIGYTARFASAVAALQCRSLGGRAGIPTLRETTAFLRKDSGQ